jgi:hypothetical protein
MRGLIIAETCNLYWFFSVMFEDVFTKMHFVGTKHDRKSCILDGINTLVYLAVRTNFKHYYTTITTPPCHISTPIQPSPLHATSILPYHHHITSSPYLNNSPIPPLHYLHAIKSLQYHHHPTPM